ncbi:hypothetical protein TIFTF001_006196 [Ficus carica]|uniref:WEB family protein n=1 Tax=Ficus carica TaxID=3494 RepID=A0AA88D0F8_FICCA|nr:hypothetical protein TIFTF001_006196 [Ficus carica]
MVNIRMKENGSGSPRAEFGEIDTRAPFQSVKAAVNLFGEVATPRGKPTIKRRLSSESVLDKETQLPLAQRELNTIKEQLESAETTKSRALSELERANRTLQDLTSMLKTVNESKQSAIVAAEAVKELAKKLEVEKSKKAIGTEAWKRELDRTRKEYTITVAELDASKQELTKIRQDFDAALEAKLAAFQQAGEAQRSANTNAEKVSQFSKQISAMQASIQQFKLASQQVQEEQAKIVVEKEASLQSCISAKEEAEKKLESMRKEVDPEVTKDLEAKLKEATSEVEVLQEQMRKAHESEMENLRIVTVELDEATKTLQGVAEEESSLRTLVGLLKTELASMKKEMEMESAAIQQEQRFKLQKLMEETEGARREEQEMKRHANKLKQEAKDSRVSAEEAEKRLKITLIEAEEAKVAEQRAVGDVKILSQGQKMADDSCEENGAKMKLSVKEFNALTRKVEESQHLAETKEAESEALEREIKARKTEAEKRLEANLKAIEEIKAATDMALRKAEMAESAKTVVEVELRRWRQEEQRGSRS